jgi:hypothetical protein
VSSGAINVSFEYTVPADVDAALKNHARWCCHGPWPHPLPPTESIFAKYIVSSDANCWDAVYDEAGRVSIVDLHAPVYVPVPIDTQSAELVQGVWSSLVRHDRLIERRVWVAEYLGVRSMTREESARELGIPVSRYEVVLMGVVELVAHAMAAGRRA